MGSLFFGRPFWITFGGLTACFGLAIFVFQTPWTALALTFFAVLAFALTWHKTEWGLALAFAELFGNSHGHLISTDVLGFSLSLRIVIFLGVMLAWGVRVLAKKSPLPWRDARLLPFVVLAFAVIVGAVVGLAQNDRRAAFDDGNAYLYIFYILPILSVRWDNASRRLMLQVLAAGTLWVATMTLGLLYVFTHIPAAFLASVYGFIRDTRTGELTKMSGNLFRIFLQAQFSTLIFLLFVAPFAFLKSPTRHTKLLVFLQIIAAAVLAISLSRSFWVGALAAAPVFLALLWCVRGQIESVWKGIGVHTIAGVMGIILLALIVLFPLPYRVGSVGDLASLFGSRTTDLGDVAISSRWNLLPPMWDEVKSSPIIGSGFGETVTFVTDDPRARAITGDGTWTTYAFEWGWLDLWLKMGILGPLAFLGIFASLVWGLVPLLKTERAWMAIAGISSLVALYAVHVFSPYLNHPLGLGLLLFLVIFLQPKTPTPVKVEASERLRKTSRQMSTAPLISE